MKTALLFAGQATQYAGMGRSLYERFPEARARFDQADEALGESLSRLCFEGPAERLDLTENTQPAVLTVAVAAYEVLRARGFSPAVVAGHSLGEYGALVAAEALRFEDAVRLCRRRGQAMQAAVAPGAGAMLAVQRLEDEQILEICAQVSGLCVPAAYNAPKLTVLSGEAAAIAEATSLLGEAGALVEPLAVSAPFHCPLLAPAADALAKALAETAFGPLRWPFIPNVAPTWHEALSPAELRALLTQQVVAPVRWRETIALMLAAGIERFVHVGPGRTNLTHVKKQARRAVCATTDEPDDLDALLKSLAP